MIRKYLGQETNSISYRHRLTVYATAERPYILISYQTYINPKKQIFPLTLYFIYDILKIYYVLWQTAEIFAAFR